MYMKRTVYISTYYGIDSNEEVKEFQMCTMTYGVSVAPYLAIRCLHQLDKDDGPSFPLAQGLLITNTYLDDIKAGGNTVEEMIALQRQVIVLLYQGSFQLKK